MVKVLVIGAEQLTQVTVLVTVLRGVATTTSGTLTGVVPVVMTVSVVMVTGPVHVIHGTVVVKVVRGVQKDFWNCD